MAFHWQADGDPALNDDREFNFTQFMIYFVCFLICWCSFVASLYYKYDSKSDCSLRNTLICLFCFSVWCFDSNCYRVHLNLFSKCDKQTILSRQNNDMIGVYNGLFEQCVSIKWRNSLFIWLCLLIQYIVLCIFLHIPWSDCKHHKSPQNTRCLYIIYTANTIWVTSDPCNTTPSVVILKYN